MLSWSSIILLCTGFAILSLHKTRYINNDNENNIEDTLVLRRSQSDVEYDHPSQLPWTDVDPSSTSRGRHRPSSEDEEDVDDIHYYDAPSGDGVGGGGMAVFIQPRDGTIRSISLLGERNSGTRWIFGHLSECFNHTIPVRRSLSRYKHWFQYDDPNIIPENTLTIAMFRNPIDWTWAMKEVPHHATMHLDLNWTEFVSRTWNMDRVCNDLLWLERQTNANNATGRICQENFHYHEVVSCLVRPCPDGYWATPYRHRYSRHQPFYEMRVNDPEGRPYDNILEMRADKIRNFVETGTYENVDGFWHYQYEALLRTGTGDLIERIERATGRTRNYDKCKIYGPQNRRTRPVDPDFYDYMIEHVDWDAEALIGYEKPRSLEHEG